MLDGIFQDQIILVLGEVELRDLLQPSIQFLLVHLVELREDWILLFEVFLYFCLDVYLIGYMGDVKEVLILTIPFFFVHVIFDFKFKNDQNSGRNGEEVEVELENEGTMVAVREVLN